MSSLRAVKAIRPLVLRRAISIRGNGPESQPRRTSLIDNAPGWNEDLATASEASVKADREPVTLDEMQKKTVDYVHWHAHRDTDVEQTHATYAREEVGGPLGSAGMAEFEGVVGHDDLGPDAQVEANGRVVTRRVTREETTVRQGGATG